MNKQRRAIRHSVTLLAEKYLDGSMNYQEFLDSLPDDSSIANDTPLAELVHMIGHLDDDRDLIEEDEQYRIDTLRNIRRQIDAVREASE